MIVTKPEIQQARIPNKNIKLVHHTKRLLIGLCKKSQQQQLFIQQIQLNTHTIILTPAQATKKKNKPICSIYAALFPSPSPFIILINGCYKNIKYYNKFLQHYPCL